MPPKDKIPSRGSQEESDGYKLTSVLEGKEEKKRQLHKMTHTSGNCVNCLCIIFDNVTLLCGDEMAWNRNIDEYHCT